MDNSPLGALPKEIRDQIAELALTSKGSIVFEENVKSRRLHLSNIGRLEGDSDVDPHKNATIFELLSGWPATCKQAYTESKNLFFIVNKFVFKSAHEDFSFLENGYRPRVNASAITNGFPKIDNAFLWLELANVSHIRSLTLSLGMWYEERIEENTLRGLRRDIKGLRGCIHPTAIISINMKLILTYRHIYATNPGLKKHLCNSMMPLSVEIGDAKRAFDEIVPGVRQQINDTVKVAQKDPNFVKLTLSEEKCIDLVKAFVYGVHDQEINTPVAAVAHLSDN